jgi:beta-galactosidase
LEAKFSGGNLLVAGAATNQYRSVDLSKFANQYRNERGWFGDQSHTMKDLPFGAQTFANVPFDVYEFKTSPAPNCVMLGGDGVPGNLPEKVEIPINQLASGLFFLQTARLDRRRTEPELAEGKAIEFAAYVVTYADGSTVRVPIRGQLEVDDYRTEVPKPLPGAVVGWTGKDSSSGKPSTAYMMTWTNPKPAIAIRSVTLTYGPDRFGVPVLLALTLAR